MKEFLVENYLPTEKRKGTEKQVFSSTSYLSLLKWGLDDYDRSLPT